MRLKPLYFQRKLKKYLTKTKKYDIIYISKVKKVKKINKKIQKRIKKVLTKHKTFDIINI